MKVLVTGATGQVGSAVVRLLKSKLPGVKVHTPGREDLDLTAAESISGYIRQTRPRWIISCAAYTAVDAAESHPEEARSVNADAPGVLAEEAAAIGAGLLHFSTDYVFNGNGERPWLESDGTGPLNVYGSTKLEGERAIAAVAGRSPLAYAVLRTSWVYSGSGRNFVRTMLRLLSTRTEPLRIVADQHGAPTAAADLATVVLALMGQAEERAGGGRLADAFSGVYHCAGTGETTWAGLANAVRKYLRVQYGLESPEIIPVPSSEYPTPAARPLNSRLNCDLLARTFGLFMPHWQTSLPLALQELAATELPER